MPEMYTFFFISVPLRAILVKHHTLHTCTISFANLVEMSITKDTLHGRKVHFLLYMSSCSEDFTETSHITLRITDL